MTNFKDKYGPWAIVAGAAEGLGEAYTIALARRKMNIFLVDNQAYAMARLADRVEQEFGVETQQLVQDLAVEGATENIMQATDNLECKLLIYNAAYSRITRIENYSVDELNRFINVNIRTQTLLVRAFTERLQQAGSGGILLMSSLAGLLGMKYIAPYAASKAYAWNFAEALHHELRSHNIDIAGAIATPAYLKTKPKGGGVRLSVHEPKEVAEAALNKLGRKTLFIPGFGNRLNYFILTRILPRKLASKLANSAMSKMYPGI